MKSRCLSVLLGLLANLVVRAQGTIQFVYDQQASTNDAVPVLGGGQTMQQIASPWGESFTPGLSSVGFVRLALDDENVNDGLGVTLSLNLRADSITGTILSSADPVVLPNGFVGVKDFIFSTPVSVTPGTTYYFEPVVESGGSWGILGGGNTYDGGTRIIAGLPDNTSDYWFREGVVVPEPSTVALFVLGLGVFCFTRRRR